MFVVLALLTVNSAVWGKSCPTYACHGPGTDWYAQCYNETNYNYEMQVCSDPLQMHCNVQPGSKGSAFCSGAPAHVPIAKLPGEHCTLSSHCLSDQCHRNRCVGQKTGASCQSSQNCDVGLFCGRANTCVPQLGLNMKCMTDWDCVNSMACNRTLFEQGTCVRYYTIELGQPVGMCVTDLYQGVSSLCEEDSCVQQTKGENGLGVCVPAMQNTLSYPQKCTEDSDCKGQNKAAQDVRGLCECGMNAQGDAYCGAFTGDKPSMEARDLRQQHLRSHNIHKCHSMGRFSDFCMQKTLSPQRFQIYMSASLLSMNTARYTDNDYCVQKILNSDSYSQPMYEHTCRAYTCDEDGQMQDGTCIMYSEGVNEFVLKQCQGQASHFCDLALSVHKPYYNVTCEAAPVTNSTKYPGQDCKYDYDCIFDVTCGTDNLCKGLSIDSDCKRTRECELGSFCRTRFNDNPKNFSLSMTCAPLFKEKYRGCMIDTECSLTAGCDGFSDATPGTCVRYFSVGTGGLVDCAKSGFNHFCKTGTCYNPGTRGRGKCVDPPTLVGSHPLSCTTDSQCIGKAGDYLFEGTCQCGYNSGGHSFCLPFTGDEQGQLYMSKIKSILTYEGAEDICQTDLRYSPACWSAVAAKRQVTDFNSTLVTYYNYKNYAQYIENSKCVKDVITFDYWDLLPNPGPGPVPPTPEGHGATVLITGALLLAL